MAGSRGWLWGRSLVLGVEHVGEETSRFHGLCSLPFTLTCRNVGESPLSIGRGGGAEFRGSRGERCGPEGCPGPLIESGAQPSNVTNCSSVGITFSGRRSWLLRTVLCQLGRSPSPGLRWAGRSSCQDSVCHRRAVEEGTPASRGPGGSRDILGTSFGGRP